MVDVVLDPWMHRWLGVEAIDVVGKAVSLQGMRKGDVRTRDLNFWGYSKVSRGRIANDGLTGSLPTAAASCREATNKLNRDNSKQFGVAACFKIVQDLSCVLPM